MSNTILAHNASPQYHQWAMLVFSYENRFNLSYNDGCDRVWSTHGERFQSACSKPGKHRPIRHGVGSEMNRALGHLCACVGSGAE